MQTTPRASLLLCALTALSAACASSRPGQGGAPPAELALEQQRPAPMRALPALTGEGVFYVEGPAPTRPRVRYLDGQVSLNTSCAIQLGNKLNRKIPPVYVNGRPVGFC